MDLCSYGLEPINFNTGNFLLETADWDWAGPGESRLTLTRSYNTQSPEKDGPFGAKWSSPLGEHLVLYTEGDVLYCSAGGAQIAFRRAEDGSYTGGEAQSLRLETEDDEYRVVEKDGTAHGFTGAGLLKYLAWPDGNRVDFTRDEDGLLTGAQLPGGEHLEIECDRNGHITAIVGLGGSTLKFAYNGKYLSKVTDSSGAEIRYVYDGLGRMTEWYDAAGNRQVRNSYDNRSRVIRQLDANGGEATLAYFDDHTVITDAEGAVSEVWFDAQGRTTRTVDANGAEIAYEYDQNSNIIAITDALGNTTRYEYDATGNKTKETAPDGSSYSLQYDENNNLIRLTDQRGGVTLYEYDEHNRLIRQTNPDGGMTAYTYNDLGQVLTVTDPMGNVTAYEYDGTDLIRSTDPNGNETGYAYDAQHRLTGTTDALGNTTRYEYDAADNLAKVTDALGHVTSYTYDALGNLTSETDALGNTVKYSYTPEGWLETVTDAEGHVTRYTYDRTGNILTADYAGEQTEANTYNELGLLTTVTTAEGDTLYQYDDASRLLSVTQPNGETVSYTYDSHSNRATMTYPNGKTVKYSYDDMNRLIAVKGIDGATTKYEYDALGRRIATDGAKEDTTYSYDEVGNLVSQTTTGAYDLALEYAYDLSGRMTSESRTENGATLESVFTYDPLGQLTSFTRSDGQSETYTYDPVGNMTAKTQNGVTTAMRYNAANQLVQRVSGTDKTTYTYDANGNLVRSENAGGARSYAYNALNLLQSFTREDGYSETYTYNANRLLSEIRTSEDLTTTLTWDILYGDGVVISADQNGKSTNYTYGLERISAISGSTRTEYVYDARGSVAAEVSYNNAWYTFGGGLARKNVVSKSYSPFGELLTEQTSGFGYNGEYYSAATGMIYLRARFYAPEMNRFGQKDLLRGRITDPLSLNRYPYCTNDPIDFCDPSGMAIVRNTMVQMTDGGGSGTQTVGQGTVPCPTKKTANESHHHGARS